MMWSRLLALISRWFGSVPEIRQNNSPGKIRGEFANIVPLTENDDPIKFDFSFRKNILGDLEHHFEVLRRFRAIDSDSFDLYSQIGCYLMPDTTAAGTKIEPWFLQHRPSFGAFSLFSVIDHEDEVLRPRFLYFAKYDRAKAPPAIERTNLGDVYVLTAYYEDLERSGLQFPNSLAVALSPDGTITPLRTLVRGKKEIRAKRNGGNRRRGEVFSIPTRNWQLPEFGDRKEKDHSQHLIDLFIVAANFFQSAAEGGMTRIDIGKGNLHLIISVDPKRTAYFFHDREKTRLPGGSSKRIFHIVRAHRRVVGGSDRYVKFHFRGERDFMWNDYHVKITVPHWHHSDVAEFDALVHDSEVDEEGITSKEIGRFIQGIVNGRPLGELRK